MLIQAQSYSKGNATIDYLSIHLLYSRKCIFFKHAPYVYANPKGSLELLLVISLTTTYDETKLVHKRTYGLAYSAVHKQSNNNLAWWCIMHVMMKCTERLLLSYYNLLQPSGAICYSELNKKHEQKNHLCWFLQSTWRPSPNIPQRLTVIILQILIMHQYICIGGKPVKNMMQIRITPTHQSMLDCTYLSTFRPSLSFSGQVLKFELFLSRNLQYSG